MDLRITVPSAGTRKAVHLQPSMKIKDCEAEIRSKVNMDNDYTDYSNWGLFFLTEDDPKSNGKWLDPAKHLDFYDLKVNDLIEYKQRVGRISVQYFDAVKVFMLDMSLTVDQLLLAIGEKLGVKNAEEEYGLLPAGSTSDWLKGTLAISEQVKSMDQVFTLKQRFFFSTANVGTDDPMALHGVYCQTRDDIVAGHHPMSAEDAAGFAALQMQVQQGDFNPAKHKAGYVPMADVMPPQFRKKNFEPPIFATWKTVVGMSDLNAKYRYLQQARQLKTFGMTCFATKEKVQGKKRMIDALLCLTRQNIIRMELETKAVIREYTYKQLLRWAAKSETFTLDFGAYEEDLVVVVTKEGEKIASLIAGYVDLLLKQARDTGIVIDDDDAETAEISEISIPRHATVASKIEELKSEYSTGLVADVYDARSAAQAVEFMVNDIFGQDISYSDSSDIGAQSLDALSIEMGGFFAQGNLAEIACSGDRQKIAFAAQKIGHMAEKLIRSAHKGVLSGGDPDGLLLDSSKGVSVALRDLLRAMNYLAEHPDDEKALRDLERKKVAAMAALVKIRAAGRGVRSDEDYQMLFRETAKAANMNALLMLRDARDFSRDIKDASLREQLLATAQELENMTQDMIAISTTLAPTSQDKEVIEMLKQSANATRSRAKALLGQAKKSEVDPRVVRRMTTAYDRLGDSLKQMLELTTLPTMDTANDAESFVHGVQTILQNAAALTGNEDDAETLKEYGVAIRNAVQRVGIAGKGIASVADSQTRGVIAQNLKELVSGARDLLGAVQTTAGNMNDDKARALMIENARRLIEQTQSLLENSGHAVELAALYKAAKLAAAATTSLTTTSYRASGKISDSSVRGPLQESTDQAALSIRSLLELIHKSAQTDAEGNRFLAPREEIVAEVDKFTPVAYKLVSSSRYAGAKIKDSDSKKDIMYSSSQAAKALQKLLAQRRAMKTMAAQNEAARAFKRFAETSAKLDTAIADSEAGQLELRGEQGAALYSLAKAVDEMRAVSTNLSTTARSSPEDLGAAMDRVAATTQQIVSAGIALASSVADKELQQSVLGAVKQSVDRLSDFMQLARAAAINPDDTNLSNLLLDAGKEVSLALAALTTTSKSMIPRQISEFQDKQAAKMESLAERELRGAANVIAQCVARLEAARAAAAQRAAATKATGEFDVKQQNMQDAILNSAESIAGATGELIRWATAVQRETESGKAAPDKSKVSYKADPAWSEGLVSAAKIVAGSVQHLVGNANSSLEGTKTEEALIVSAQAVGVATTQLVMASTVKANATSDNQHQLRLAAGKVGGATEGLVKAAQGAAQFAEQQLKEIEVAKYAKGSSRVAEIEAQTMLSSLEEELEKARRVLAQMRKAQYAGSNASSIRI